MTSTYQTILFDVADGVATLTLNRPERLNAVNLAMHADLRDAITRAEGDPAVRCLLLTGAGRGFCAGQDLTVRKQSEEEGSPDLGDSLGAWYNPLIRRLATIEKPVICAVNGVAAGAGVSIALACDMVIDVAGLPRRHAARADTGEHHCGAVDGAVPGGRELDRQSGACRRRHRER